ncbi:hypothetical protein ACERK3_16840 [Phycisphaerales bacterium AB-hyl4]|uniref:Lipid A 3-O-deacylase PagL n=1 Tax=Natronomicrosphaera hydrolytica TaxID=3242702 RepID=A0ABV4UAP9_9BACT
MRIWFSKHWQVPGVVAMVVCLVVGGPAMGGDDWLEQPWHPERDWSVTAFIGQWDESRFAEILTFRGGDMKASYLAGFALNRRIARKANDIVHWEVEASVFRHWRIQDNWEGNLALVVRWTAFPWDRYVNTSAAFGSGVSLASEKPKLEGTTREFLHHLLAEVEFAPPGDTPWSGVARVHHRSGAFGLYGRHGGSNAITLGLRYRF